MSPKSSNPSDYTVTQTARISGYGPLYIYRLLREERLPGAYKTSGGTCGRWRIPAAVVELLRQKKARYGAQMIVDYPNRRRMLAASTDASTDAPTVSAAAPIEMAP